MKFHVFISYSARDKTVADAICARLESEGIKCWIAPRNILPGLDWSEAIVEAIENCLIMVLVFSSNANASPQIKREVERATHKGKIIIPFRIHDIEPSKALEYFISTSHWLDALTPPLEAHIMRLASTIQAIVSRKRDSTRQSEASQFIHMPAQPATVRTWRPKKRLAAWLAISTATAILVGAILWFLLRPNGFYGRIAGQRPQWAHTENTMEIQKRPSWNSLIDTARKLRQEGNISESLAVFAKYGDIYGDKYPSAKHYTTVAQSFTMQCRDLGVTGGAYIYKVAEGGAASSSGLRVGDIIIAYGDQPVSSTKSFVDSRVNMERGKKVRIDFLRMDQTGNFSKLHLIVSSGPLGIFVMDI